jgi:hypothetical protein
MKLARVYTTLLSGVLLASCAPHPEPPARKSQATVNGTVNLSTLSRSSLLETGRMYSAQVKRETADGRTSWRVRNPPIPPHYAVGFQWLNLSNLNNPREGLWTFVVKAIERWHDPTRGDPMGTFTASYQCDVLRIEDARK